jgi:hypothetical protein
MTESGEQEHPDFDRLGRESLWPADEWRAAWRRLPDQEHRAALWPTIIHLGSGRPSRAAVALVQAAQSGSTDGAS